jgi:hypothetical protein
MARTKKAQPTKEQALEVARYLGCRGAHQREDGVWQPCASEEVLQRISNRAETADTSRLYKSANKKKRKRKKVGWENLIERGVMGISTTADGGLVSAPIAAKAVLGAPRRVRPTDPDVFTNAESARVRSRQLGCIGIRRYSSTTGGEVWMPCNNESDYRRRMGVGPQAARDKRREQARFEQRVIRNLGKKKDADWGAVRGIPVSDLEEKAGRRKARKDRSAATPALPKERIVGSSTNSAGSAASVSSARDIEISQDTVRGLLTKVRNHNKRMEELGKPDWTKASIGALKSVWRRGAGAFSVSHRPNMTRQQWAMGRVNAFLRMLEKGKPDNLRYIGDSDLLPESHPWKKKNRKDAFTADVSTKARKVRGIAAGFDPDALDGDGDGKVQEGTPFERPASPKRALDAVVRTASRLTTAGGGERPDRRKELGLDDIPSMLWTPDQSTADAFGKGRGRGFVKERVDKVHNRILSALRGEVKTKNKNGNKTAYIIGGPVAVGKTTLRTEYGPQIGVPGRDGALHLDPDEIRELLPEYKDWILNPMVSAPELTHAESMHLVQEGVKDAIANNLDVVHDTTGRDFRDVISNLDAAGYKKIAHFATGDLQQAIDQAAERARLTMRWRDPNDIRRSFKGVSQAVQSYLNADTFDEFYLWDTSQRPPVMIAKKLKGSPLQIFDKTAWAKMLNGGR